MIDASLITTSHLLVFTAVFVATAFALSYESRRQHTRIGIPLAAIAALGAALYVPQIPMLISLLAALLLVAVIGKADEILPLSPAWQLGWQFCIAITVVLGGWTIPFVSNPFGAGVISLAPFGLGAILAVFWIVLMMNAVNWLDGMDGLAGGVGLVGFVSLAVVAMLPSIFNSDALGLALVGCGAALGFFIWNFPPARVYLGTVGSWFLGIFLALTAMYGGGKIATASLILALPLFDVLVVIVRRLMNGKSVFKGDTINHIHHRLLQQGVSPRMIIAAAIVVTSWLALVSIVTDTTSKIMLAFIGIIAIAIWALRLRGIRRILKPNGNE